MQREGCGAAGEDFFVVARKRGLMYLFSRRARLAPGNTREAITWATSITEKVNQITGLNVGLYALTFSPGVGKLSWSTFVPDLPTLEAANDKLLVDDGYASMLDAGAKFALGGADDALLQIVYGEPDPSRQIEYVTTVQTVCASGNLTQGIELGIEIAQQAEKVLGTPVLFATGVTGNYGAVGWLSGYADVQEMERAQQALAADAKFAAFVDKGVRGVYVDEPTETQQLIYRRIA
jgi:hypothetical protein